MATKAQKLSRLSNGPDPVPPIPTVPRLPDFLKERFPQFAEQIELYNQQWVDFLKKTGTIANT